MSTAVAPTHVEFSAALYDPSRPAPEGLMAWNGSDPARRFGVYRNNVVASLIDALADTFPVVQALVGEEFFAAMAAVFVRRHPPRSRVLAEYGAGFAEFVDGFEPARPLPYLPDLARLEWARVLAFHAADAAPLGGAEVQRALAAAGDRTGELQLRLHPSVSLIESRHAVASVWAAHQGDGELAGVDAGRGEAALVLRDGLAVLVLPLPAGDAAFVAALVRGEALGPAAAAGVNAIGFDLTAALARLFGYGALVAIDLPAEGAA